MSKVQLFSILVEGFHREDTDQELKKIVTDLAAALEKAGYAICLNMVDWSHDEGGEQDFQRAQTLPSAPRLLHIERAQRETEADAAADAEPEPEPEPEEESPAGEPDEGITGATVDRGPESEPPAGEGEGGSDEGEDEF